MMETSTSVNKLNYEQQNQQELRAEDVETKDLLFYNNIKAQLDGLIKDPSDEVIAKIVAYSKAK